MHKKYITVLTLIISILILSSGCNYSAYKDYYTKTEDYAQIWNLTGFNYTAKDAELFPKSIENSDVQKFFCRYDQQLPLGEGVQVFLEIRYKDKTLFETETERISSITTPCDDLFKKSFFSAYATCIGQNYSSCYALIDKNRQVIYYIYLQNIPIEEIEFGYKFIPKGYSGYGEVK